ncbi:MAG: hypothetical protein JNL04_24770 [Rhodospirillaceae bacterium]|nr:hypothetical protein [Rhodospirillaceae bacterium]
MAKFSVYLKNHGHGSLVTIGDILQPIAAGLAEAGHSIQYENHFLYNRPIINLLVEYFVDTAFVDDLIEKKRALGSDFALGVLVTEDVGDPLVMDNPSFPGRLANLRRVLEVADFVWSLVPAEVYAGIVSDPARLAFLRLGYVHALAEKRRTGGQDIDVLVYGQPVPRRDAIMAEISRRGWIVRSTFGVMPDYIRLDMLRRSKMILDIRRADWIRFNSPSRIVAGLHAGVAVASELFETGGLAYLFDFARTAPYDQLADAVDRLLKEDAVGFGIEAQRRFRLQAPMRAFLKEPLSVADLPA